MHPLDEFDKTWAEAAYRVEVRAPDGRLAEAMVYKKPLTDEELVKTLDYVRTKYGPTVRMYVRQLIEPKP